MLIKYSRGAKKKKIVEEANHLHMRRVWRCSSARAEAPRVRGKRPFPPAPRALRPAVWRHDPDNSQVTPEDGRLVAFTARGPTLHLRPPRGSQGGGCPGTRRGVPAARRGAATGSARDGSPARTASPGLAARRRS